MSTDDLKKLNPKISDQINFDPVEDGNEFICLACGYEFESPMTHLDCPECFSFSLVQKIKCHHCGKIMVARIDDPYHGPELLLCPDCLKNI